MRKYTYQNPTLKSVDESPRARLDARYTEIPVKCFPFSFTITEDLKAGSTIELARFPNFATLHQVMLEHNFENIKFELNTTNNQVLLTSEAGKVSDVFSVGVPGESLVLRVIKGKVKKGEYVRGYAMFSAR